MSKKPLDIIMESDGELFENITAAKNSAFSEGALTVKSKLLIALALDASHGSVNGVRTLAKKALDEGASKDEIMEALRVAYYISGVGCIYTAAQALDDIF